MLKPEDRTSDYVCFKCGKKYSDKCRKHLVTCHEGQCGICGKWTDITHIRAFNYLKNEDSRDKNIPDNEFSNDLEYQPSMDTAYHYWLQDKYKESRKWYEETRIKKQQKHTA